MQRDMSEHGEIAKALKARLAELRTHLAKVNVELHKPLPADSEDQAIELENQEALEVIEKTETTEIHHRGRRPPTPTKEHPAAAAKIQPRQAPAEDGAGSLTTSKLNAVRAAFKKASSFPGCRGSSGC